MTNPLILILSGRSGSGKSTQAEFLQRDFGFVVSSMGQMLRSRKEQKDFTGTKIHKVIDKGGLVPDTITLQLIMQSLEELHEREEEKIIIDGTPRTVRAARLLTDVLEWYDWRQVTFLNVVISDEEAMKRLSARGRHDDAKEDIANRLDWFNKEVGPVLEYYKEQGIRVDVNGEQSPEEVYKEMQAKLQI